MPYIDLSSGVFGLSAGQVRPLLPHVSFSDGADLTEHGFAPYAETAQPACLWHEVCEEAEPVDGQQVWTVEPSPAPLADVKALRNAMVTAKREAVFAGGFSPASGPLMGHTLQVHRDADKINWLTSQASYSAAVAAGHGSAPGATFRTLANETVILTYAQGLTIIVQSMAAWGAAIMGRSWALKDEIEAAADLAELIAIDIDTGWPS